MNEIRIGVYGENQASPALKAVETDSDKAAASIDRLGESTRKTSEHADRAGSSLRGVTERTDELDESGSHATSALGALGSGFELIGKTNVQDKLNQVALATDFMSGVGEGATLVIGKLGGALKGVGGVSGAVSAGLGKVKEGFTDAGSAAGKVTTGLLAAGAAAAALVATYKILNSVFDHQQLSATDTKDGLMRIARSGEITNDSLVGLSSNTDLLRHDLDSLNGTMSQHIKNLGDQDLGLHIWAEGSGKTNERLKALDQSLADLVSSGNADVAAAAFKQLADMAAKDGVSVKELSGGLPLYTEAAKAAADQTNDNADAANSAADANERQKTSLEDLNDEFKAATDPAFAYIDATNDAEEAQNRYNAAVKKSGPSSKEAKAALRDLAKATGDQSAAATALAQSTNGKLTPAMEDMLTKAGWSKTQIAALKVQLQQAYAAADKWAGNYTATFTIKTRGNAPDAILGSGGLDINYENKRKAGRNWKGGVIGAAANGRTSGGVTLVGEYGPELLDLPPGTAVTTAGDTVRKEQSQELAYAQELMKFLKTGNGLMYEDGSFTGMSNSINNNAMHSVWDSLVGTGGSSTWKNPSQAKLQGIIDSLTKQMAPHSASSAPSTPGAAPAGGQPLVINLVLDGKVLATQMVDPMRDIVRAQARGSVQQMYGQKGVK